MEMTKDLYESKMDEYGLNTYEELEEYRFILSKQFDEYIASLSLFSNVAELSDYKANIDVISEEYKIIVDMVSFGSINRLY